MHAKQPPGGPIADPLLAVLSFSVVSTLLLWLLASVGAAVGGWSFGVMVKTFWGDDFGGIAFWGLWLVADGIALLFAVLAPVFHLVGLFTSWWALRRTDYTSERRRLFLMGAVYHLVSGFLAVAGVAGVTMLAYAIAQPAK